MWHTVALIALMIFMFLTGIALGFLIGALSVALSAAKETLSFLAPAWAKVESPDDDVPKS